MNPQCFKFSCFPSFVHLFFILKYFTQLKLHPQHLKFFHLPSFSRISHVLRLNHRARIDSCSNYLIKLSAYTFLSIVVRKPSCLPKYVSEISVVKARDWRCQLVLQAKRFHSRRTTPRKECSRRKDLRPRTIATWVTLSRPEILLATVTAAPPSAYPVAPNFLAKYAHEILTLLNTSEKRNETNNIFLHSNHAI